MNQHVKAATLALLVGLATAVPAGAQTASRERLLAEGWAAIAAGKPAAATDAAARLLKASPGDHDAASLTIAAALADAGPARALDAYERWLAATREEDRFLLEPIAVGALRELAGGSESRIAYRALGALARRGDSTAKARLATLSTESTPIEADLELARAGDPQAVERLRGRLAAGGPGERTAVVEALRESDQPGAAAAIAEGLRDSAPPTRIAAAHALAELGAADAIPQLRAALKDDDPSVRGAVRIALGLLGDPEAAEAVASLAESPVGGYRLLLVQREARRDPHGAWAPAAEGLLGDDDPIVRVRAAELLLRYNRGTRAEAVLDAVLADPSAAVRTLAARALARSGRLPVLRRMLRDAVADVRLEAALALAGKN